MSSSSRFLGCFFPVVFLSIPHCFQTQLWKKRKTGEETTKTQQQATFTKREIGRRRRAAAGRRAGYELRDRRGGGGTGKKFNYRRNLEQGRGGGDGEKKGGGGEEMDLTIADRHTHGRRPKAGWQYPIVSCLSKNRGRLTPPLSRILRCKWPS